MSAKLNCAAIAAALSVLVLAAPAQAAEAEIYQYDEQASAEVIRADGWQDEARGPRDGRREGHHDGFQESGNDGIWLVGHKRRHVHRHRHLRPWEVRFKLRRRGFHHMHFVDRWAPVYKLRATGPRGRRVFLVVSSRTGRIIDRHPIRRRHWR